MAFNSITYFLFIPIVYLVFRIAGERIRWCVLLAASLIFYAALDVPYLLAVMGLVTVVTYGFGIWLDGAESPKVRQRLLWGGITANVLILIVMKYLPFLSENLNSLAALLAYDTRIQPVPVFVAIGVSFYVFQAVSYLIDIYLEVERPERHFGLFALYMSFFPKLLQGPIERAGELLPQLRAKYVFDYDAVRSGMMLFMWGMFKKVVVAERLSSYVNSVYGDVHAYTGLPLLLATYGYAFQIYCDFSGYTDMAIGSALLFNIHLVQNFNAPYLATSLADFWRRWHISFSRWILDYLFKPLQMELRDFRKLGTAVALIVTFLVSGVWHGASWGYIVWGLLHGIYLSAATLFKPVQMKLHRALHLEKSRLLKIWQIGITFHLVCFSWVFFRAKTIPDAYHIVTNLFTGVGKVSELLFLNGKAELLITVCTLGIVLLADSRPKTWTLEDTFFQRPVFLRWSVYTLLVISTLFLAIDSVNLFIYTQF